MLQGVHNNYDIDLFRALIHASEDATGVGSTATTAASHRIIADHLRASSFLIADGVLPSNEGRGYVLRRIMRRAMRHAHLLGAKDPLLHRLVGALVREMGEAYPELVRAQPLITETLQLEETRFLRTLSRGLTLLDEATGSLGAGDRLDGETAFRLYDTFGFPYDLTEDALKARGIGVDRAGFETAMERQKTEARASWAGSGEAATETVWFGLRERLGATEFLGYASASAMAAVTALVSGGAEVAKLGTGESGAVVVNQTPFYGESGGQVGDTGVITWTGGRFRVTDTQKRAGGLFVHVGVVEEGELTVDAEVVMTVDAVRRGAISSNHSATHLLHEALRQVLGTHVAQKGSQVSPDRLRFDFSHTKPVSEAEIAAIETMANAIVLQDSPVVTRLMGVDDAIASGAMALFGEKYGDEVRVVSMGTALEGEKAGKDYSVELCGGIHVGRTGEIGLVHVLQESAVASGVRRLEALTGHAARQYLAEQEKRLKDVAGALKVPVADVLDRVQALVEERRKLERDLAEARKKLAMGGGGGADEVQEISGIKFLGKIAEGVAPKELKGLVDEGKKRLGSGVVVMIGLAEDGKAAWSSA
ncbi:Alanine--tRNA ligase [Methylobrevis pamukkalensis]|uniref:Alanine--tRNA ligase n=1 Tax=Methylobrevis pamukkalensis TaxID=1439726 RepID=A0A1E3H2K2_9HYPH|nr:Alanine--tRNA ligase [Methylobrevis pamukkalensis]